MITIYDVLRKPHITEKALSMKETNNEVFFKVHPDANKQQIKDAVEQLFSVKVKDVRTMNFQGKQKRFGRNVGRRQDWKKAIVVLEAGQTLDFV